MSDFTPTAEQVAALDLFKSGRSMVIEAGAGTGKTSTLRLLAESNTDRRIRYLAFNKAIVTDVAGTMPKSVAASTAHSLAFKAVGKPYAHRLNAPRVASWRLAQMLDIRSLALRYGTERKTLSEKYLAGLVMRSIVRFCQTVDETPTWRHMPYIEGIDAPDDAGNRTYENNNRVARELEPAMLRAWADISRTDGGLPFRHDHYLKLWQLSHPTSVYDCIFFDEAQDANPVMAAVIAEQTHAQRVYVGDANQEIYAFTGAVNSIEEMKRTGLDVSYLSQSFRFGQPVADIANGYLELLNATLRLTGNPAITSTVGPLDVEPDAYLCRTNAGAVNRVLDLQSRDVAAHLVGGGGEVVSFARAAADLQAGQPTTHFDLACFNTWREVQDYVEHDAQGDELRLMVNLVDSYGVDTILKALDDMPTQAQATVTVSTAHKSKGREWARVTIDEDFAEIEPSEPEWRLQYVAVTRAREHLDLSLLTANTF